MFKKTLSCLVAVGGVFVFHLLFMPAAVAGITIPETHCITAGCDDPAPSRSSSPSYDYEAERRAQEQAEAARRAEAERQAELERQRKAEEERRRQEEAERQAKFIRDRDDAANSLRGSTGTSSGGAGGSVLRGSGMDTGLRGLKGTSGSFSEAGSHLKSAEKHGRTAESLRGEVSSEQARKGFDTAGEKSGSLVYPDKNSGGRSTFGSTLPPAAKNDPQIQQSLAWYRKNDSLKADAAKKIAVIKEQQKKGTGDQAVLSAQIGTLKNQMKEYADNEAKAKQDIKAKVKKDFGLSWDEK